MSVTQLDDRMVRLDDRAVRQAARPQRRGRRLLCWWLVASAIWLAVVVVGFCGKVNDQIDSTRAIGRELQAMDCESAGRTGCAHRGLADYEGSWTEVAAVFATFGLWHILPIALLPPAALLFLGFAACGCSRALRKEE